MLQHIKKYTMLKIFSTRFFLCNVCLSISLIFRYISTEPEAVPLVGEWEEACTEFQKMLFIRSCRPDRISFCITSYIVRNLSQSFVEPPVLDLKAVLDDSVAQTPLIFVLSPGADPASALVQLAESQDMSVQFMMLSLGQGQASIATRFIIKSKYFSNNNIKFSKVKYFNKSNIKY